jgi:hypothetical protein
MSDHKAIAAYRDFLSIERQAELGVLPETLTISQIAVLHPDRDDFARLLLEAWAVYCHRDFTQGKDPELYPPLDLKLGNGLRGELASGPVMFHIMMMANTTWAPDPPADDVRNGLFVSVHRDDLKAWLQEVGLWPLEPDVALNAWWSEQLSDANGEEPDEATIEKRIKEIVRVAKDELRFNPLEIPDGGKASIKENCLSNATLFTKATFDSAWKAARKRDLVKMKNHDKYAKLTR